MAKLENKQNTNQTNPVKTETNAKNKKMSLWLKVPLYLICGVLALVLLLLITINLPVTKRYIASQAIELLNKDFKMKLELDDVEVNFFGDVRLKGVRMKDYRDFQFITAKEIQANSDWFALALNTNDLKFNKIALIEPDVKVITYKGDSISNFIRYIDNFSNDKPSDPNKIFRMNMMVDIQNGKASIVNENHEGDAGRWLDAKDIFLHSKSVKIEGSDVSVDIDKFKFITKRWGKEHVVDQFSTHFEITKKHLKLDDLVFNTNHSLMMGAVTLNLDPKTGFADFGDKVKWDLRFDRGSQLSGYDLSYFVDDWDNYVPIKMSGAMTGPLNKMQLENFQVAAKDVNLHAKVLKIADVMHGRFFVESQQLDADLTYKGLKAMLPSFIAKNLGNIADDFGRLKYKGAISAKPEEIFANGEAITGIGQAKISNFYLTDYSTKVPRYRGYFDVKDLNVTAFTNNKQVGLVSGKFNVDGRSFDINTMHLRTKSEISRIELMEKKITNVLLDGVLDRKTYRGLVNVNDPNAKASVNGLVDFSSARLKADVIADLKHVNLQHWGVSAGDMTAVSAKIDAKVAMTNLNDLTLDARFKDLTLISPKEKLVLPNSDIKAFFENDNRVVSLDAPGAVKGQLQGHFNLEDLGKMFNNSLNKVLVGNPPRKTYQGQYFNFDFDVRQGLVAFFMPELGIPEGLHIAGDYQGATNDLVVNADAAYIKYVMTKQEELTEAEKFLAETDEHYKPIMKKTVDSAMVNNLQLRVNTADLQQQVLLTAERAEYNKNVIKDLQLKANNEDGEKLHISTLLKLGSIEDEKQDKLKTYTVNINQTTNTRGDYVLRFEPTQVKFNDIAWNIDTSAELDHSITYQVKEKDFKVHNLRIYSDESSLLIKEALFKSAKDFEADVDVSQFEIAKLLALTASENDDPSLDLKGIANGSIKIKMNDKNLEPIIDMKIDGIKMNGEDMGNFTINANKSSKPNVFDIDIQATTSELLGGNNLQVLGTIDNNTKSPTLDLHADMKDFDLRFAQQFVKDIFGNFRGKATGALKIAGTLSDLDYSGDIGLSGFGLRLLFTGVDYRFSDTVINLSRGQALINSVEVSDGRANSRGRISGMIQFETLSSMALNLILEADNLLVLNSTQEDNDLFWGRVYAKGDLYVSGPVSGLEIATPEMRALNMSSFTFNSNSTTTVEEFKMLRFLKRDETGLIVAEEKKKRGNNMLIDFNLVVDKGTTVNVLVGDDVGDISVRGDSNPLKFRMERNGNVGINGTYVVDNGTFISKAILSRTFQIARGSKIRWDGNPMTPDLAINANYMRTVTNAGEYLGLSLQPINVQLTADISGTLVRPEIQFGVKAPDVSSQVKEALAAKMADESERIIQFGSILAMNSFNVSNLAGFDINIGRTAETAGYNMLFKQLGSVLNTISNVYQIDLGYIQGDAGSNTGDRVNTSVSFDLSPRVKIKTGLGIPVARSENASTNNFLSGEGIIEYDWSRNNNGSRLLRAYSKPSNIGVGVASAGLNQSYGAGAVYSKSFDSFKFLFKSDRKEKKKNKKDDKNQVVKIDSIRNDTIR